MSLLLLDFMCVEKDRLRQSGEKSLVGGRILDRLTAELAAGSHQELTLTTRPDRYGDPHRTLVDILSTGHGSEAKFTGIDRKNRTISLSIKAKDADEEAAAIKDYTRTSGPAGAKLGDVLKEQLENSGD